MDPKGVDDVCRPCAPGFYSQISDSLACIRADVCGAGEGLVTMATPSANVNCRACTLGSSFKPVEGNDACTPVLATPCPAGTKTVAATLTTNVQCVACEEGTYQDKEGQLTCTEQVVCAPGTYVATELSLPCKSVMQCGRML